MIRRHIVLVTLFTGLYLCHTYMIQCPQISQWNYSAESFQCFPANRYLCLYNTVVRRIEETCRAKEERGKIGSKYVLSQNQNRVDCSTEYFQPFIFTSVGNSQCVYKKSTCTEEGQIIYSNGSTETDRTCRCDYTKHYVYVTPPNNICSCKPSEEDCSCYLRPCTGDNEIMISDYKCVPKNMKPSPEQMKCTEITTSSLSPSVGPTPGRTSDIQFSETSVSAIEASVPILFFAVLFVLLVLAICVNVRPQVRSTKVVYREDLIVTGNFGKSITVIEGERLEIKCEYTSKLPVKSITWQQRKLDGNVQPINSMQNQTSSLASPLIIDNIHTDHSGKYECVLTNNIGLSNTTYDRFPLFCHILRDLPAYRPEKMNSMGIKVCSLPDAYATISVFKGKDGTLEINEQNYTRVMWFKHEEKLTSIEPTDKYNKYTNSKPSLTIKVVDFTDVGRYVCVVVNGQGKVESIGFKLRVIPQEYIYSQVLQHRSDTIYVRTGDVDKVNTCLQQYGTVVLTGRAGTGKSKLCLQIASSCEELDYLPYVVDLSNNSPEDFGPSKILCIIDCTWYNSQDPERLKTLLRDLKSRENVQMLITSRNTDIINVQTILQECNVLKEGNMIDLNESLTSEEKKEIMNKHMEANNIAPSSPEESNFCMEETTTILYNRIQVKIDTKTIEEIIKTEPLHGFPQTVADFCKDRQLLHLGKRYFTNLPKSLESEIVQLAKSYDSKGSPLSELEYLKRMKYCVLAYIATDEKKCLDVRNINTDRLEQLYRILYDGQSNIDWNTTIKDTIKDLARQFLIDKGGIYEFVHPDILTNIYVSHEHFTIYLIQEGNFREIKECIRSPKYHCEEGKMVCKLNIEHDGKIYQHLCRRLITEASIDGVNATDLGMYIYDQFIKLQDDIFRREIIYILESRISTEKSLPSRRDNAKGFIECIISYSNNMLLDSVNAFVESTLSTKRIPLTQKDQVPKTHASGRQSVSEEPIDISSTVKKDTSFEISFLQTVLLLDKMTQNGKDSWILLQYTDESAHQEKESRRHTLEIPGIILLCGLIVTCLEKRQNDECKKYLIRQFELKLQHEHESFLKTLMKRVDLYGNTFFHYLVIFMEEESHSILEILL